MCAGRRFSSPARAEPMRIPTRTDSKEVPRMLAYHMQDEGEWAVLQGAYTRGVNKLLKPAAC